jgi:sensor histidine kinase YesM
MKPETKPTKQALSKTLRLNDTGFRLVLIPFFGIAIPLLTNMVKAADFTHWQIKLSFAYTIFLAFVVWQGNRYLLFSLRSYFDWFNRPVRKIIALVVAVTFFTVPISSVMLIGWYQLFKNGQVNWQVVNTATLIIMICVLFITHVYETVFLVKESESEMVRNEQLERAKAEAELDALKNQVDPHFMFNALNTISYLIDNSPEKAKSFNERLADVYRYILQNKARNLVMVHEEMTFLQDYFALQKIRYGAAVILQDNLDEDVLNHYVIPPISMQLLAENAFKHNEFSIMEPLEIRIYFENGKMVFYNRKRKKTAKKPTSKLGLYNLQERYKLTTGQLMEVVENDQSFIVHLPLLRID